MLEKIKLKIRKAQHADIEEIFAKLYDDEALFNLLGALPEQKEDMKKAMSLVVDQGYLSQPENILLIAETTKLIGLIYLENIDWKNRNLFGSIGLVPEIRKTVYGLKLAFETARICFEELNMHRVSYEVNEENAKLKEIIEKLGLYPEGFIKNYVMKGDKRFGAWQFGIFRNDYLNLAEIVRKH